jgi:hypothetical protein
VDSEILIIENDRYRMYAGVVDKDPLFDHIRIVKLNRDRHKELHEKEILYWDHLEWEERGTEAFEAIMGCVRKFWLNALIQVRPAPRCPKKTGKPVEDFVHDPEV